MVKFVYHLSSGMKWNGLVSNKYQPLDGIRDILSTREWKILNGSLIVRYHYGSATWMKLHNLISSLEER